MAARFIKEIEPGVRSALIKQDAAVLKKGGCINNCVTGYLVI